MKKYVYIGVAVIIIAVGYYGVNAFFTVTRDIPTRPVTFGEFVITINTSGTIEAKRAFVLSAPRIRGLTITWLAPEGSNVKEGDPVIRFDDTQQKADVADNESELKIKQTALERARQEHTIQDKQLKLELEKAQRNYDEKKHEAPRVAEEAKLELELATLNFQAKLDQLVADVQKAEVEVQRAKDKLDLATKELEQTIVKAPIPGMVVYLEIWKGGTMGKVQAGDSPWPGQGLVNLPDLSEMIVKTAVSEVDASRADTGQLVDVVLDALPDKIYDGKVIKKGTLARKKDYNSKINVFDIDVSISQPDAQLKPGMSASCDIVVERIADVVSVPLEAVFEKEGQTVVYLKNEKRRDVKVGRKNDMAIEIVEGLRDGDQVCLVDPTLEEKGLPGDKAKEPEINQGRPQKTDMPRRPQR
jgi:HlyD family secretion protein